MEEYKYRVSRKTGVIFSKDVALIHDNLIKTNDIREAMVESIPIVHKNIKGYGSIDRHNLIVGIIYILKCSREERVYTNV